VINPGNYTKIESEPLLHAESQAASVGAIAREEGVTQSYVARVMRLAFLAPDITQAILDGRQPDQVTANRLVLWSQLPLAWPEQRKSLGFE
jgi:hypothetical protein